MTECQKEKQTPISHDPLNMTQPIPSTASAPIFEIGDRSPGRKLQTKKCSNCFKRVDVHSYNEHLSNCLSAKFGTRDIQSSSESSKLSVNTSDITPSKEEAYKCVKC